MSFQNRKILLFLDRCAAHPQDTRYLKRVKVVFFPPQTAPGFSNHLTREQSSHSNIITTINSKEIV
jgi:hypothetical protein